ncbi:FecR family protein [Pseudovibrio sp. JE062]|uniref:FecR family protein n=1 Tax=Pseudovibrio sp. JE062 TaxID=439495 RepID=UPI000186F65E|nr:FecR family protein [Pseudovibrio sp. JE062]EEA93413.1 FecR protein [Pseudovibrio sp. JE062]
MSSFQDNIAKDDQEARIFSHPDPIADEALNWFLKLQEDTSDEQRKQFSAWFNTSEQHQQEFARLEEIWGASAFRKAVGELKTVSAHPPATKTHPQKTFRKLTGVAAAFALMIGATQFSDWWIYLQADYTTQSAEMRQISLPDGSSMLMNSETAVALDFEGSQRHVHILRGEAYFDVLHDAQRPFQVTGGFGEVTVLGTAFSVLASRTEDRVVLERGRVELTRANDAETARELKPGELSRISKIGIEESKKINPAEVLAWREGRLVLEDVPLSKAVEEIERYYSSSIFITSSALRDIRVSGYFKTDNLIEAIETLALATGADLYQLPTGIYFMN